MYSNYYKKIFIQVYLATKMSEKQKKVLVLVKYHFSFFILPPTISFLLMDLIIVLHLEVFN